ncbi:uncharacterized protein LOC114355667 [Ostrinia furnacalis]|uniref:uncharacterized protein LOC114355667 n=1 Tax=Ostrinia furnacalis TaxID=93504 RepID=UPI00103E305D|nr:uncharacterized protein LOC114355667 [Ostrinia furnacalis]
MSAESSPFSRSGITRRSPQPPSTPQNVSQDQGDAPVVISTSDLQGWMSAIEQHLNEVCHIASEGKLNSDQKLRINNICRKVGHGVAQMAVKYQSLKQKAIETHSAIQQLKKERDLTDCLLEMKQSVEACTKHQPASTSFADMVKKGSNNFIRPNPFSSVAIFPNDASKTSDDTKTLVQNIICPEEMKLKVRSVRKTRNGGVIISTETKQDMEKLKSSVNLVNSGLTVDETNKRKPRIIIIGVPCSMAEADVLKCIYEQNLADKLPTMSRDTFLTSIKLSHKSGRKNLENTNYVIEVPAVIRKALISQDRLFINWTSCPVRDFTLVTRCFKCQQYGHAAKTCKAASPTCGHCGEDGHSIQECSKKADSPKCATCLRFKKPCGHKTGDTECPARKAAENRYINSIDYEGA